MIVHSSLMDKERGRRIDNSSGIWLLYTPSPMMSALRRDEIPVAHFSFLLPLAFIYLAFGFG